MILMCPLMDEEPWPTLGPWLVQWIEENLCYGPGDLLGQPVELNDEIRAWLYRMYEVEPAFLVARRRKVIVRTPNPKAGRRRFNRCALSLRKGSTKTEIASWITAAELHPDAPVRCAGFESDGVTPIPRGVSDPYIPMIAYTEEQSEELAYGALRRILQEVPIGNDFDIGLERIMRIGGDGKAEAVSSSPSARDGARTTFQHADETHRFTLDGLKRTWTVMLANLPKRPLADPWALETTTAPEPGGGSVAESTMEYARQVLNGKATNPRLFFFHRQASDEHDLSTREGCKAAIVEASGPYVAEWSNIDSIADAFEEPDADRAYLERVWTNRLVQSTGRAFDIDQWRRLLRPDYRPAAGVAICLGFDGSRYDDATSLVGVEVESGHLFTLGVWPAPAIAHLPKEEADAVANAWVLEIAGAVDDAFATYHVCRMYCDPPKWESWISKWAGQYGDKVVVEWWTNRRRQMAYAIRSFITALMGSELTHDGDAQLDEHVANARQSPTGLVDEDDKPLWVLKKERPNSPKKIDAAMAAVLSWEARNDAVAAGEGEVAEYELLIAG